MLLLFYCKGKEEILCKKMLNREQDLHSLKWQCFRNYRDPCLQKQVKGK